uniref:Ice-binding protein C-terminal domain-containing protein n=1 Tax=Solibacter usitatus (strain Ellin6076) TaxID=234267 RepID=Q01RG6_SOLUE
MKFHKLIKLFAMVAIAMLVLASVTHASPINGSLPLNGGNLTQNGTDLSLSTMISATLTTNLSTGSGDYAFIPFGTNFGPTTLNYTSNATLSTFTFGNAVWGTFVASANPANEVVQKTANFLDVFIIGTFTPGTNAGWAGKDPTQSSLRFSINQSGSSISEAITLNSPATPPPAVPEPQTMALIGSALAGLAFVSRKRWNIDK